MANWNSDEDDYEEAEPIAYHYETSQAMEDVYWIVQDYLTQIRMGYTMNVTLQDVLEELEGVIKW